MIEREAMPYLQDWRQRTDRKPLVIRGARQVGKSFLVRQFAEREFGNLLEINFENEPAVAAYFGKSDAMATVALLEAHCGKRVHPGTTLLFLDEIQAAPEVLARLRYFHEQKPGLHVVAAGSLLEFALAEHQFSMPVGRIEYLHLGPVRFGEFLHAAGDQGLADFCDRYTPGADFPVGLHERLVERLKNYLVVGGMPAALDTFIREGGYAAAARVLQSVLQTLADDFAKYGAKANRQHLLCAWRALPRLVGQRLKYVNVSREFRAADVARALHLLEMARLTYLVHHCAATGMPLGATINPKVFKPLLLDVGLLLSALGLDATDLESGDLMLVNSGTVCEQFVGQHLLNRPPLYRAPELHYWTREEPSANAEIDYAIGVGPHAIPVEIKAGKIGTLRSLHQFMVTHSSPMAVRLNLDLPSLSRAEGALPTGVRYSYPLLSLPVYMVEQVERLVRAELVAASGSPAKGALSTRFVPPFTVPHEGRRPSTGCTRSAASVPVAADKSTVTSPPSGK